MRFDKKNIKQVKEDIINGISDGSSLMKVLRTGENMPERKLVYKWLNSESDAFDAEFEKNYQFARENSADIDAEKIEEIAEKVLNEEYRSDNARVAVDALKWAAGVKKPKKYGLKIDHSTNGKDLNSQIIIHMPDNER